MTTNPNEIEAAVARVFYESALEQSQRLGVPPQKYESPGQWKDRVRQAAIIELLSAASARGVADGWKFGGGEAPVGAWVTSPNGDTVSQYGIKEAQAMARRVGLAGVCAKLEVFSEFIAMLSAAPSSPAATPEVEREAIARAIGQADSSFGYTFNMTKLVDGVATHTLTMPGYDPEHFEDRDDGYRLIEERRNRVRADAILALFRTPPTPAGEGNPDANDMAEADAEVERILAMSDEEVMEGVTPEEIAKMRRDIDRLSRTFAAGRRSGFIAGRDAAAKYCDDKLFYEFGADIRAIEPNG